MVFVCENGKKKELGNLNQPAKLSDYKEISTNYETNNSLAAIG